MNENKRRRLTDAEIEATAHERKVDVRVHRFNKIFKGKTKVTFVDRDDRTVRRIFEKRGNGRWRTKDVWNDGYDYFSERRLLTHYKPVKIEKCGDVVTVK